MRKFNRKIVMLISLMVIVLTAIGVAVYALIVSSSARGDIKVNEISVTANAQYNSANDDITFTFNQPADQRNVRIAITSSSGVVLHNYYQISYQAAAGNQELSKAILVYFNGEFINTLDSIISNSMIIEDEYSFIPSSKTLTDTITFELHQSIMKDYYDGKSVNITITTIAANADYSDYIFVSNENEFRAAVDDINSGLFATNPQIVLIDDISLSNTYTIINPAQIVLNRYSLNGNLILNDTDALIELLGTGTFGANIIQLQQHN